MNNQLPENQTGDAKTIQAGTSNSLVFKFERISSVPPIRFNPDTPDRAMNKTASTGGSRSSLSSSMTPEIMPSSRLPSSMQNGFLHGGNGSSFTPAMPSFPSPSSNANTTAYGTKESKSGSPKNHELLSGNARPPTTSSAPYQASYDGKKPPGKLTTQYVMPDGSVITGKGLGRGRPGVKRGPRKSKAPDEDSRESTPTVSANPTKSLSTPASTKRKRADSNASSIRIGSFSSSLNSRESSVEYNPTATQTRSGRQTQKPAPLVAPPAATPPVAASPASKKPTTPMIATPTLRTHPKIKRKVYRGKEQLALCEHCLRGFGPPGNVIVFCDACNKCWHQRCHQPQISKELVADTSAEWFCATCDKILHGNKKAKKPPPPKIEAPPPPPQEQRFEPPFVGAIALTIEQRKKYLQTLSRDQLVNLLLRAGELAPQMPIFETPIPLPHLGPYLQPQFTSDYVTPVSITPGSEKAGSLDVPDEGYDDSYDEHAALYPKVGEGVQLPPEREDLNMLLEGPDSRTFSHWVKGMPVKTVVDTVPLHQSQFSK